MQPSEAGLEINEQAIADEAMMVGRTGNVFSQFGWWIGHIFATVQVPVRGSIDDVAIEEVFDTWDAEVIALPRLAGSSGVDRWAPNARVPDGRAPVSTGPPPAPSSRQAFSPWSRSARRSRRRPSCPVLTNADVDLAVDEAEAMLVEPIQLDP